MLSDKLYALEIMKKKSIKFQRTKSFNNFNDTATWLKKDLTSEIQK